jgi:nucleoside-diphosphate-sugar epimerase
VRNHATLGILRVPGIYSPQRLPLARLQKGTPALLAADDVWTNHIHADDLAHMIVKALWCAQPGRVYHTCDDTQLPMGDYFDLVADAFQLPRPPRLSREALQREVSPLLWSFMSESRRLKNTRIKHEFGVRLRYATVRECLVEIAIKNL